MVSAFSSGGNVGVLVAASAGKAKQASKSGRRKNVIDFLWMYAVRSKTNRKITTLVSMPRVL